MEDQTTQNTPTEVAKKPNPQLAMGLLVIAIVILAGVGGIMFVNKNGSAPVVESAETTAPAASTATVAASQPASEKDTSAFKNGTYTVVGNYTSPGGAEEIDVKVTLADGVITDAIVTPKATRPMSVKFQGLFAGGYKDLVVGKSIAELNLTKVSGSSLTPKGFNDALEKIKAQAAA